MQSYFIKKMVEKSSGLALFRILKSSLTNSRWVVVSTQGFGYMVCPTIYTVNFSFYQFHQRDFQIELTKDHFQLESIMGKIRLQSASPFSLIDLTLNLMKGMLLSKRLSRNRFGSFSQIHMSNLSKVYANGYQDSYFEDLYKVLTRARYSVYITDWFFSP